MSGKIRCEWGTDEGIYKEYHDKEWRYHVDEEQRRFELLSLRGAHERLNWITILKRRENYRKAFDNFDPSIVCTYDEEKIEALRQNEGIIRNQLKIRSVVTNAEAFVKVQEEFGSFDKYVWQFVDGKPILNDWKSHDEVPASTKESALLSKDLKKRGFKFVGPVICYAFMQAIGMVNDHTTDCFLYHGN